MIYNNICDARLLITLEILQIKEEQLLRARHVGEAINILQEATQNAYDPEEVLTVIHVT